MSDEQDAFSSQTHSGNSRNGYNHVADQEPEDEIHRRSPSPNPQPSLVHERNPFLTPANKSSVSSQKNESPNADLKTFQRPPSTVLPRSSYALFLTLFYIVLALFSWILTCILSFRPVTTGHYGFWISRGYSSEYDYDGSNLHFSYVENE